MKSLLLLLLLVFLIPFVSLSQDIDLNKVPTKTAALKTKKVKDKIFYPFEVSLGYGKLFSLNNDSIVVSYANPNGGMVDYGFNMLYFDTINKFNVYTSYNLGLRKRYGNFRLGLNAQYSFLEANNESPYKDYYWEDLNGTSLLSIDYKSNDLKQNANILCFNITTEYLFIKTPKIGLSLGVNLGGLVHKYINNFNSTYINYSYSSSWNGPGNTYITTLESIDSVYSESKTEFKTTSFNISPTFCAEYKISNALKLQCSIFYNFQLNRKINSTSNYFSIINGEEQSSESNSNGIARYYNTSKIGFNINMIFSLGKEKSK
jgi:hypothetical protein